MAKMAGRESAEYRASHILQEKKQGGKALKEHGLNYNQPGRRKIKIFGHVEDGSRRRRVLVRTLNHHPVCACGAATPPGQEGQLRFVWVSVRNRARSSRPAIGTSSRIGSRRDVCLRSPA
jgi:hypothetical protein